MRSIHKRTTTQVLESAREKGVEGRIEIVFAEVLKSTVMVC